MTAETLSFRKAALWRCLFFIFSFSPAFAQVALEETQTGGSSSSNSVTTDNDISAFDDHLYIAVISTKSKKNVISVDGLGLTWTALIDQCSGRSQTGIMVWTAQGTPSGNGKVTAVFDNSPNSAVIAVARYAGVSADDAVGAFLSGNGNGLDGNCSGGSDNRAYNFSFNTSSNDAVIAGFAAFRNRNHTPGDGYTSDLTASQGSGGSMVSLSIMRRDAATAGTYALDGTFSGDVDWAVAAVEIKSGDSGPTAYTLSAAASPQIGGAVTVNPDSTQYLGNTLVSLTASPAAGYEFVNWSGDIGGAIPTDLQIDVTMNQHRNIAANFALIQYDLTTTNDPANGGSVDRNPDKTTYNEGESVDLTANPATGFEFSHWSGDIAGANASDLSISVTMDQDRSVQANYTPIQRSLTLSPSPANGGSATASPDKATYNHGETVNLTATAAAGFEFIGWSGDIGGANAAAASISLTMDQNRIISANFAPLPESVTAMVASSDNSPLTNTQITATIGIDMTESNSLLGDFAGGLSWDEAVLAYAAHGGLQNGFSGMVDIAATASGQLSFDGSHASGLDGAFDALVVTFDVIGSANAASDLDLAFSAMNAFGGGSMLADLTVSDDAITIDGYSLSGAISPVNGGSGTLTPQKSKYDNGESVNLTAQPANGFEFSHWSGDIGGANPNDLSIDVIMDQDRDIIMHFSPIQRALTLDVTPGGSGSVSANPDKSTYDHGESVSLTASAASGYQFSHWSGDIGGANAGSTISVTMDQDRSITANFVEGAAEVTYEGTTTGGSSGAFFVETGENVPGVSDQLYLAAISSKPFKTVSDVSGLGLNWTRVDLQCSGRSHNMVDIWMAIGMPSADDIVRADFDDDPNHAVIAVSRYSGVDPVTPVGNNASANSNGADGSCSGGGDERNYTFDLTTTTNNALIYAVASTRNKTHTPGSAYTEKFEFFQGSGSDIVNIAMQEQLVEIAGAKTVNGGLSGRADWSAVAIEILPGGSSGPPRYSLAVVADPVAGGSVAKNPDQANYEENENVTATATAATNYEFSHWSGDIGGANANDASVSVTMDQHRSLNAHFTLVQRTLTTSITPGGSGSVSKNPDQATYDHGANVTLTATPAADFEFVNWSGDIGGASAANPSISVTMDQDRNITAHFQPLPEYVFSAVTPSDAAPFSGTSITATINVDMSATNSALGSFTGSLNWDAAALTFSSHSGLQNGFTGAVDAANGTSGSLDFSGNHASGAGGNPDILQVTFNVIGAANDASALDLAFSTMQSFAGLDLIPTLTVTDSSITISGHSLAATVAPNNGGSIAISPDKNVYDNGESVNLTATANAGYLFSHWSGDNDSVDSTAAAISTMMDGDKSLTANFTPIQRTLTVDHTPTGAGSISLSPDKATYDHGETVMITALAASGFQFGNWSGNIGGANANSSSIAVTMDQDRSISANFAIGNAEIVYQGTATGGSSDAFFVETGSSVTAANDHLYLAAISTKPAKNVTGVSGLGLAWTKVDAQCSGRSHNMVEIWMALGTPSGDGIVRADFDDDPNHAVIAVSRYSGVDVATPIGNDASANSNGADGSCSGGSDERDYTFNLTTTADGAVVYSVVSLRNKTHTPVEGVTEQLEVSQGDGSDIVNIAVLEQLAETAGAQNISGNFSGNADWSAVGLEIMPAGSSGPRQFAVTKIVDPAGRGSIALSPDKISYDEGESVTATTNGASGWRFLNWSGDIGTANPTDISINLSMIQDRSITAHFEEIPGMISQIIPADDTPFPGSALNATIHMDMIPIGDALGSFNGSLSWDSTVLNYTGNGGLQNGFTGAIDANNAGSGQLTFSGSHGSGVSGAFDLLQINFTVTGSATSSSDLDLAYSALANAAAADLLAEAVTIESSITVVGNLLTIAVDSSLHGGVSAAPEKASYDPADNVTITAASHSGYEFSNWSGNIGGANTNDNPLTVIMDQSRNIIANFTPLQRSLTLSVSPADSGTVSADPVKTTYDHGEDVTLTATSASGLFFESWSGDVPTGQENANPLTVTMDQDRNLTANFAPGGNSDTPPNFKVAFFGDQGISSNAVALMNMIKDEGADMIIHTGDLDYGSDPDDWVNQIGQVFPDDFPYFAVFGDKETSALTGSGSYQEKCETRMNLIGISWDGSLGIQSSFTYNGIFFVLTAPGVSGSHHHNYIRDQFAADNSIWRISVFHKNMRDMSPGLIGSGIGWDVYENARKAGAFIVTGDDHIYGRSHLMSSMENQIVASTSDTLVLTKDNLSTPEDEGRNFVAVSGLGGRGRNAQRNFSSEWASIYSRLDDAGPGALFGVFNYNGQPDLAWFYFKDKNGVVADEFYVRSATQAPPIAAKAGNGNAASALTFSPVESAMLKSTPQTGITRDNFTGNTGESEAFGEKNTISNDPIQNTPSIGKNANAIGTIVEESADGKNLTLMAAPLPEHRYFWKFEAAGMEQPVERATLRFYTAASDTNAPSVQLFAVSNSQLNKSVPWNSKNLTASNAPSTSGKPLHRAGSVHQGRWMEFDAASVITGDGVYSFAITATSDQAQLFAMNDDEFAPQLILRTSAAPSGDKLSGTSSEGQAEEEDIATLETEASVSLTSPTLPGEFAVLGNYPNPFNPKTTIRYALPEAAHVRITIYNVLGQAMQTLVDAQQSAGFQSVQWHGIRNNGQQASSGIYFMLMKAGPHQFVQKIVLQR